MVGQRAEGGDGERGHDLSLETRAGFLYNKSGHQGRKPEHRQPPGPNHGDFMRRRDAIIALGALGLGGLERRVRLTLLALSGLGLARRRR